MADWQEMYDGVIAAIEEQLAGDGWERNGDGEWERELFVEDLGDVSRYIGQRPLATIMIGGAAEVYGTGAQGVANFIEGSYVTEEFEENFAEMFKGLDDEQLEWLDDEDNWGEVSSYIQGWVRPVVNAADIAVWLEEQGW